MLSEDDFQYALENTEVIRPPEKRLETFSTTIFNYILITEDMDQINLSKVREGSIHSERPQIITPENYSKLMLEGFGEKAHDFAEMISHQAQQWAILRYGFRVSKSDIREYEVHEPMTAVAARVRDEVESRNDPLSAVVTGVDDGWEVCLLKFMLDLSLASGGGNIKDFNDRGLL
jgi:hypothetical protein